MKKRALIGVLAVLAVAAALGISFAGNKEVAWTPEQLSVPAVWGQTTTTTVSFVSDKNLNKVEVLIDPNLQRYVAVTPSSVGKVTKGQAVSLTFTISAQQNDPIQVLTGAIRLTKDGKKLFDSLLVTLSIEPIVLPPDPGEAGLQTLEGIDADEDGLRDDLQRYIELTYPDEPGIRAGLRQYALPLQRALLEATSEEAALRNRDQTSRAADCFDVLTGDLARSRETRDALVAKALNTKERSEAYLLYDSQLGGHIFSIAPLGTPIEELCDFDPITGRAR